MPPSHLLPTLAALMLAIPSPTVQAQPPVTLTHSIPVPSVGFQPNARLGYSVAVDGGYAVAGAPDDEFGGIGSQEDNGVVKVFDSATGTLLFVIPNPTPADNDHFGFAVAISGTLVVVGTPYDNTGTLINMTDSGSVYVFDLSSGTPTMPVFTLNNPSPAVNDNFGCAVAVSGTRVVVGACQNYTGYPGGINAGSVYVYELSSETPTVPVFTLNNPSPAADDSFGSAVAVSGTRVVVGAIWDDTNASNAGSAYIFDLGSGTPTVPVFTLNNPSPAVNDNFGCAVAVSGGSVVVGAWQDDTYSGNAGIAYVYDLGGGTPTVPVHLLKHPSHAAGDQFGVAVAISGTRVVVGANRDDVTNPVFSGDSGSAYVFDLVSATPSVPVASLSNPSPESFEEFGCAVAVSGAQVLVGAHKDNTNARYAGSAYVYDMMSGTPTMPVATLNNPGLSAGDYFGYSVAVSGTWMVVGAPFSMEGRSSAGSVYVYDLGGSTPTVPKFALNNPSPLTSDQFGRSVAVSGMRVVVGAPGAGNGEVTETKVYVYDLGSDTPTVPMITLNNPSQGDVFFGGKVAISGTRVVVGDSYNDTSATNAGRAYVYDLADETPTVPVVTLNNPSPAQYDYFGTAVAISGAWVVVGAAHNDTGATDAGSVYVYDLGNENPALPVHILDNPAAAIEDFFGDSVAITDTRVVVGVPGKNVTWAEAGGAYVFDLASETPTVPVVTLNNPSPALYEYFGESVAISGARVVVGAYLDGTGASGAGSVYVYDLDSGTPTVPSFAINNPEPAVNDGFGTSVALDTARIVIGAPFDDKVMINKGFSYVYGLDAPEIALSGNSLEIANGDNTPSAADHTEFGALLEDDGLVSRTFTITNSVRRSCCSTAHQSWWLSAAATPSV